jgi:hypothetical protein
MGVVETAFFVLVYRLMQTKIVSLEPVGCNVQARSVLELLILSDMRGGYLLRKVMLT